MFLNIIKVIVLLSGFTVMIAVLYALHAETYRIYNTGAIDAAAFLAVLCVFLDFLVLAVILESFND